MCLCDGLGAREDVVCQRVMILHFPFLSFLITFNFSCLVLVFIMYMFNVLLTFSVYGMHVFNDFIHFWYA